MTLYAQLIINRKRNFQLIFLPFLHRTLNLWYIKPFIMIGVFLSQNMFAYNFIIEKKMLQYKMDISMTEPLIDN